MKLTTLILVLIVTVAFVGSAMASPPGKTMEYAGGDAGKVIFNGDTHGAKQGMKCNDCHPKPFAMKKGTYKMTKEQHGNPDGCGKCHDGKKTFSQSTEADCAKCHKGITDFSIASANIKPELSTQNELEATPKKLKAPPELKIISIALEEPSGNGILDAEEKGKIKVIVKNSGTGSGFGVVLNLEVEGNKTIKGLKFNKKTNVGKINSGDEKIIEINISASEDVDTTDVALKVTAIESNGFDSIPMILAFKTRELIPPLLQISKIEIQDADGKRVITKGKQVTITVNVQNAGSGVARGVLAEIDARSSDIMIFGERNFLIGSLSPGESKNINFSFAVNQRYSGSKSLPVAFRVKEERERYSITPDIKLALNEEAPDIKVVKIETKETLIVKVEEVDDINRVPELNSDFKIINDKDIAIVIGIENYRGIPKSEYSYNDAKLVKSYLKALGFVERNIEYLIDDRATFIDIKKTIDTWLPNRIKKAQSKVFIYYSGHGAPDPSSGEAYLVPFDGDPNYISDTGYPIKRLYDKLGKLEAKEILVVMDSCFSGAGGRSVLAKGARPLVLMPEGTVLSPNIAVLSSTQGSQISTSFPEKGHGIFTYYFLKAIKDGKKDLAEIYDYIKPLVEDEARRLNVQQSPTLNPELSNLQGKFSLRK